MNLTDVDDKTINGAKQAGKPLRDYVRHYIDAFHEDRRVPADQAGASGYPRATDYVPQMVALIEGLLKKGVAYKGDDGSVYFSIARFPQYGKLSQIDMRELKTGRQRAGQHRRIRQGRCPRLRALEGGQPEDEEVGAAWDAPFGRGRPGWHLECSAMALDSWRRHWGTDVLDIHAGGVDLIFPHHEDEIAQSCAYTGQDLFARYWLHGEFLNIRGSKMSKRFGNITTPRDLRQDGIDAGAIRLLMFQTHYRQKLDLTDEALAGAREASRRLGEFQNRLLAAAGPADGGAVRRGGRPPGPGAHRGARRRPQRPARGRPRCSASRRPATRRSTPGSAAGPRAVTAWRRAEGVLGVTSSVEIGQGGNGRRQAAAG